MKGATGFFELIVLLVLMCASIPLVVALMMRCNATFYTYMDDKTTVNKSEFVVYEDVGGNVYMPVDKRPINFNLATVFAMPFVQDDWTPDQGSKMYFDMSSPSSFTSLYSGVAPTAGSNIYRYLQVSKPYGDEKYINTLNLYNQEIVQIGVLSENDKAKKMAYLIWNPVNKIWVVTFNTNKVLYKDIQ